MKLQEIGEWNLIDTITRKAIVNTNGIIAGIGDDAAVFSSPDDISTLVTTDLLVERVHFLSNLMTPSQIGHKAMAANLSDIAAMGGTPLHAFVSIALPQQTELATVEAIYDGMKSLAESYDVNILGGDTTSSQNDIIINITIVGQAKKDALLFRNAAIPGDLLCCTGSLGGSRAGLELLLDTSLPDYHFSEACIAAHTTPMPRILEGRWLATHDSVHAAIDISDGLSSDMMHIAKQSCVGILLYAEKIPLSPSTKNFCSTFGHDPLSFALAGGEDYELLFTISPDALDTIESLYSSQFSSPFIVIGEICETQKCELMYPNGHSKQIKSTGWEHFSRD